LHPKQPAVSGRSRHRCRPAADWGGAGGHSGPRANTSTRAALGVIEAWTRCFAPNLRSSLKSSSVYCLRWATLELRRWTGFGARQSAGRLSQEGGAKVEQPIDAQTRSGKSATNAGAPRTWFPITSIGRASEN